MDSVREMSISLLLLSTKEHEKKSAFNKSMFTASDHRQRGLGDARSFSPSQSLSNVLDSSPAFAPEVRDPVTPGKIIKELDECAES